MIARPFYGYLPAALIILLFAGIVYAQRVGILTPEPTPFTSGIASSIQQSLDPKFRMVDAELATSAYESLKIEAPFNQSREIAQRIGNIVGCDFFLLIKTTTARRSSSSRPSYFEASVFIWVVDARTGALVNWLIFSKQADSALEAERQLSESTNGFAEIIGSDFKAPISTEPTVTFEVFEPDSKAIRPAMPYKRFKPEYTNTAYLFDVKATVDAEVSIDEKGNVRQIDILRWAGFGLDTSVADAIRKMNWRPGERNGKPLPMRVLLRYNFTKIDKE
ncbi:MAG: energy transducer TonB [Pyrinomonadaceae bacterium]